jgi:hypothetical protein
MAVNFILATFGWLFRTGWVVQRQADRMEYSEESGVANMMEGSMTRRNSEDQWGMTFESKQW